MRGLSKKNKEVEDFVDAYTSEHGTPPTYKMIQAKFGLGACAAYNRCRKFRHKMVTGKKPLTPEEMAHKIAVALLDRKHVIAFENTFTDAVETIKFTLLNK